MAKLFKFEKEMRDLIYLLRLKSPYGLDYDNPYNSISFEYPLNARTDVSVTFEFYHYRDNDFFEVTIFVGERCHLGLFYKEDYNFIKELVEKFIRVNKC